MLGDFAELCTYVYVVTDEVYRRVVPPYDLRPGPRSGFSDGELLTVGVVAELVGLDAETRCLAYLRRNHPALFPRLPERSRYNRRRRQLAEVTNRIRGAIMERLWRVREAEGQDLCAIDSVPVPQVRDRARFGDRYIEQDLVFATHQGRPLMHRNVFREFKRLLLKANLPDIRFHDLRHTNATLMLGQGVHPKVVQERLGHSQVGITLNTYSHVLPGLGREAIERLGATLQDGGEEAEGEDATEPTGEGEVLPRGNTPD